MFSLPSSLACLAFSTILHDKTFFSTLLERNRASLIEHYGICSRYLQKHKIPYIKSNAGFYIWVDFTAYLKDMDGDTDLERERDLNERFLDNGVHLATAEAFQGEENGWFRITFTVEAETFKLAMGRYCRFLARLTCRIMQVIGVEEMPEPQDGDNLPTSVDGDEFEIVEDFEQKLRLED